MASASASANLVAVVSLIVTAAARAACRDDGLLSWETFSEAANVLDCLRGSLSLLSVLDEVDDVAEMVALAGAVIALLWAHNNTTMASQ